MALGRNLLIIRSMAFAVVTKLSGAAMVFVALPVIAHGASPADYEAFLSAMNIASIVGLVFLPFMTLTTRELSHAFVNEKAGLDQAIQNTFGMQILLTIALSGCLVSFILLYPGWVATETAMMIGITLTLLQMAAGWAEAYRVANRTDYVSNIIQTAANIVLVSSLLSITSHSISIQTICVIYFGVPALSQVIIFFHLLLTKRIKLRFGIMPIAVFKKRIHEALPLSLIPSVDYMKIYLSGMIVLLLGATNDYILFYSSILYMARLINPLSLITRPLMPAYIDALIRKDTRWLHGLKMVLAGGTIFGALLALLLPLLVSPAIISVAFPPGTQGISHSYVILCSLFAFGHGLVSLLAPLYIGGHMAGFYGISSLVFTTAGIAAGAALCSLFGALAMMGSLSLATTACGLFLLVTFLRRSRTWPL